MAEFSGITMVMESGERVDLADEEILALAEKYTVAIAKIDAPAGGGPRGPAVQRLAALCLVWHLASDGIPAHVAEPIRRWAAEWTGTVGKLSASAND